MAKNTELVFGLHAVTSALRSRAESVHEIWVDRKRGDGRMQLVLEAAAAKNIQVNHVARSQLDELVGHSRHQGVVASCQAGQWLRENQLADLLGSLAGSGFFLILDGVQDPHNLGACLRSADGAGVDGVIIPKDKAAGLTPVVRKVASGAAEATPVFQVTNLARTLRDLKDAGVWLYGMGGEAEKSLYDLDLTGSVGLVLGAEGKGLRRLTREHCDELVSLPMAGSVESLNVSVATGICLYEAVRQRGQASSGQA